MSETFQTSSRNSLFDAVVSADAYETPLGTTGAGDVGEAPALFAGELQEPVVADGAVVIDCLVDAVALVILGFGAAGGRALVEPPYADAKVKVAQQKTPHPRGGPPAGGPPTTKAA